MSSPSPTPTPDAEVRQYLQTWSRSMSQVLAQIAGAAFPVELDDAPPDPKDASAAEGDLLGIATAAGSLRGEMGLRLPRAAALSAAQLLLSEPQDPAAEFDQDHRDAAEELLRQVLGHVTTALKPDWGEVQLRIEFGAAPSWPSGASGWIGAAAGAPAPLWVEWQISAALLTALRQSRQAAAQAAAAPASPAASSSGQASGQTSGQTAGNLDLFMDVELDVTLRFGAKRMLLREILELSSGSVVELDRQVQEPADLLLDGKLIARGEVVVVDGSYGLRIVEVIAGVPNPSP